MSFPYNHKPCEVCGRHFYYERRTARYCSPKCRQRANRKYDYINSYYDLAERQINALGLMMTKGGETEARARNRLRRLISLAQSYLDDTSYHNPSASYFVCEECGQAHYGDEPPGYCSFCDKRTKWALSSLSGGIHGI